MMTMKRRDLFKMFATLAAMPLFASLAAWCKPKAEGFTHVQRVTGMRVISTGLTKNDDLFGDDQYFLERTGADEGAVKQGVQDHLRSGLSVFSSDIAKEAVQRDIDESEGDFYSERIKLANWWLHA